MPSPTPFINFTRPYGFDPATGNSMHFIFLPIEVKILAALLAAIAYLIIRKQSPKSLRPAATNVTALVAALVTASIVMAARSDMNIIDYISTVKHTYSSRHGDEKLSLIDKNMSIYAKAKQYVNAGYTLLTPGDDNLIPKLNAQYILAPFLPEEQSTAPYIIVTDTQSSYDKKTATLTTTTTTISPVTLIFAEGNGARGLYKKMPSETTRQQTSKKHDT